MMFILNIKKLIMISILFSSSLFASDYTIDKSHTNMGFSVKHMMISNLYGNFNDFDGTFDYDEKTKTLQSLNGKIRVDSINTDDIKRDKHLKAKDIFDAVKFSTINFTFTKKVSDIVYGKLTIKDITKEVKLQYEEGGMITDPWGNERVAFSLSGKIKRSDFGLTYNTLLEAGGVAIGDVVKLNIEIEGIKVK